MKQDQIAAVLEDEENQTTNIVISLDGDIEENEFIDKLAGKIAERLQSDELINNNKTYIDNNKDKEEEITKKKGWKEAQVRKIISGTNKKYCTTSDILSHDKLSDEMDQYIQAIRLMKKMNFKNDDISLFKKDPSNNRSAWIITFDRYEDELKARFKSERRRRSGRRY